MNEQERRIDEIAQAIYVAACEGYDGHPAWSDLSYPRKWRWWQAAKAARYLALTQERNDEMSLRRAQRLERNQATG